MTTTLALIPADLQSDYFTGGLWPVGGMTCVASHAADRDACDLGANVTLVANACGSKTLSFDGVHLSAAEVQVAFLGPPAVPYSKVI